MLPPALLALRSYDAGTDSWMSVPLPPNLPTSRAFLTASEFVAKEGEPTGGLSIPVYGYSPKSARTATRNARNS